MANGKLNFGIKLTIEQFKRETMVNRIDVKRNPQSGKLFFTYGGMCGAVAVKGVPANPMISAVCPEGEELDMKHIGQRGCNTFWLLHEEGEGPAPTIASF